MLPVPGGGFLGRPALWRSGGLGLALACGWGWLALALRGFRQVPALVKNNATPEDLTTALGMYSLVGELRCDSYSFALQRETINPHKTGRSASVIAEWVPTLGAGRGKQCVCVCLCVCVCVHSSSFAE